MRQIKGRTKSAAKGIYFTFSKITGRIKLKMRVKQAVKNIPIKINQSCVLSTPFACIALRKSMISPKISSPKAIKPKRAIPGPILAVVTCPTGASLVSFVKTNGVKVTNDVITTKGTTRYLYHFGNVVWLLRNKYERRKNAKLYQTEINKCILSAHRADCAVWN
jgi:hypothetical protein